MGIEEAVERLRKAISLVDDIFFDERKLDVSVKRRTIKLLRDIADLIDSRSSPSLFGIVNACRHYKVDKHWLIEKVKSGEVRAAITSPQKIIFNRLSLEEDLLRLTGLSSAPDEDAEP